MLRYPLAALYADYLRAAFGLALTVGPLLLLELADVVVAPLAALGLVFAWFGMRTVCVTSAASSCPRAPSRCAGRCRVISPGATWNA